MPRMFKKKKLIRKRRTKFFKKRTCIFCSEKSQDMDYKDVVKLSKFISERGKMVPRRASGNCARHQRIVARAIKQARVIALLPFVRK